MEQPAKVVMKVAMLPVCEKKYVASLPSLGNPVAKATSLFI
jgi:hypothetical protein